MILNESLKLDDSVIAQVVKLLQVGLLTGTDVTDHIRMIRLQRSNDNKSLLVLTSEYMATDESNIDSMLSFADDAQNDDVM